jgi:UDP-N-acetylmuramate: L-alanyl-gamma-D-glutamyl-meso-diaminopimelate ligase
LRALKVHFIAIGGTGMGALALLLRQGGHTVQGSDTALYPPMSTQLEAAGIPVAEGFGAHNLDWGPDRVVVGNVCSADHPEVIAARERGLTLTSFPALLAETLLADRRSLVVAGTHGKTTTTSLLAWLLDVAGAAPSFLIGGVPQNFGFGARLAGGPAIVLEGDEYDTAFFDKGSKFLHYRPQRAILTSVEFDHADIFADPAAMERAFAAFLALLPADGDLVVHADDARALALARDCRARLHTYAVRTAEATPPDDVTYLARVDPSAGAHRTRFELFERGRSCGWFSTQLLGAYNVGNVVAAFALARAEGLDVEPLRAAITTFRGVTRRQELVGVAAGVRVVEDFAHHPTAVQVTLDALRRRYPEGKFHVAFEPRSATSRRDVFQRGYALAFDRATRVYLGPLFRPEKVPASERLDLDALVRAIAARGPAARAYATVDALAAELLEHVAPGDTVVVLSSGAFGGLPRIVLGQLGDPVRFAAAADVARVDDLLGAYGLPAIERSASVETLVVGPFDGPVAGTVSLQAVGERAFLFGLAVEARRRGEGLGWVLGDQVLDRARCLGVREVVLLTSTAADFFAGKLGYRPTALDAVDPTLRATPNFRAWAALAGAVPMVLSLPSPGAAARSA